MQTARERRAARQSCVVTVTDDTPRIELEERVVPIIYLWWQSSDWSTFQAWLAHAQDRCLGSLELERLPPRAQLDAIMLPALAMLRSVDSLLVTMDGVGFHGSRSSRDHVGFTERASVALMRLAKNKLTIVEATVRQVLDMVSAALRDDPHGNLPVDIKCKSAFRSTEVNGRVDIMCERTHHLVTELATVLPAQHMAELAAQFAMDDAFFSWGLGPVEGDLFHMVGGGAWTDVNDDDGNDDDV